MPHLKVQYRDWEARVNKGLDNRPRKQFTQNKPIKYVFF